MLCAKNCYSNMYVFALDGATAPCRHVVLAVVEKQSKYEAVEP